MTAERIDMIRKSEYDELVREHLETRAEIVGLEAKLHEQMEWRKQAIQGWSRENDEIEQILGKVLGYPWYKDDPKNFPESTESDGVCVGEHVPATLAAEAAKKLRATLDKLKATEEALVKAKDQETELYVENGRLRVLLQQCRNTLNLADNLLHGYDQSMPKPSDAANIPICRAEIEVLYINLAKEIGPPNE